MLSVPVCLLSEHALRYLAAARVCVPLSEPDAVRPVRFKESSQQQQQQQQALFFCVRACV